MLLQEVRLHNIRSYLDETITFAPGSSLLSGDIGCGKSTILLAIEFALFGSSRTDLPAESLLRKGTMQGSVELHFQLSGNNIIIKRSLKKEKDTIKQIAGHIICNSTRKDLTPLELKAEILHLLGYPDEFLTKTKNYIFQYTVYTPQEEMKSILQENADIRLDTLRKIFNIDKYRIIRENTQSYLRSVREQMRVLETRIEPLEELKQRQMKIKDEEDHLQESLALLTPKLEEIGAQAGRCVQQVEMLEQQQREYQELQQQYATMQAILVEQKEQLRKISLQQEAIQQELHGLSVPENISLESIHQQRKELEQQQQQLLTRSTLARERATKIQTLMRDLRQEIDRITLEISTIPEKEQQAAQLQADLGAGARLLGKKKQVDELFLQTSGNIVKTETILSHSIEIKQKITTLDLCPTCLQEVLAEHKHTIEEQENIKIHHAENLLFEFRKKKIEVIDERNLVAQQLEAHTKKEYQLVILKAELYHLAQRHGAFDAKKKQLDISLQENKVLMDELASLHEEENMKEMNARLHQLQQVQEQATRRQFLLRRLEEGSPLRSDLQHKIAQMEAQHRTLVIRLQQHQDPAATIKEEKEKLTQVLYLEKSLAIQQGQLQAQLQAIQKQHIHLTENIEKLQEYTRTLIHRKEIYHWLEDYFISLTYTLEKHVMLNIHALFNQLFQEWFAILMNDEGITSHIDDSFYPVIEQNGYEIPFAMLSGGEKTSASLAYRLALNRVINDVIHQINTKDLLILDEPTDGFSSEQLDKVREVLEKLHLEQTIIVSHESKIESFVENVIRIRKEGHVSKVFSGG